MAEDNKQGSSGHSKGKVQVAGSVEGWTIMIRGIHDEAREEDVKDKFADCGDISEFHMPLDRATGYVKGYALLKFKDRSAAEKAIKEVDGVEWMDQKLKVSWAFLTGPYEDF